ncbi:MAG: dihydroorotase, partial [Candidatus Limnocylindria bacterium]
MSLLIRNARVIDPANTLDTIADILIDGGVIKQIGPRLAVGEGTEVIEAAGKVVCPGFIDIHT